VLKPPAVGDVATADERTLRRYGRYLVRYLARLGRNSSLPEPRRAEAAAAAVELRDALAGRSAANPRPGRPGRNALAELVAAAEAEHIEPLLAELDRQAELEVRDCVLHVMIGVAASPWQAMDILIVLLRNGSLVARVSRIYNSRPAVREQIAVVADTLRVVAMVKFTSLVSGLLRRSGRVPGMGWAIEPMAQAVGVGVLTSVAGHAAKDRCRAFRRWDRQEAARRLHAMVGQYVADCWQAAVEHVLPILKQRFVDVPAEAWAAASKGFSAAVQDVAHAADSFVRQPVAAGVGAVAGGGRNTYRRTRVLWRRLLRRR
jgi:hypothetical protein